MRILMVSEDVPEAALGGLARHALTLAVALAQVGHEVDFLGRAIADPDDQARQLGLPGRLYAELPNVQGGWKERQTGMYNPLKRPVLAWKLARAILARAAGYDVIHYHGHLPNVAAYIPSDVNFVQTRHDQGGDCLTHIRFRDGNICTATNPIACAGCIAERPNALQRLVSAWAVRLYRRQVRMGFRRHKTIFVSDMLRRNFVRTAGTGNWGLVVHNFVDTRAISEALASMQRDNCAHDRNIEIVIAGKLYPPKGIGQFLSEAAGRLPANMHISILGTGPEEAELRARYEGPQISFLGWQDYHSVVRHTASADAVVVPSIWEEPCATTILEALALKRKVLTLSRGGTPELSIYSGFHKQLLQYPDMGSLIAGLMTLSEFSHGESTMQVSVSVMDKIPMITNVYRGVIDE